MEKTVIKAGKLSLFPDIREMVRFKDLFLVLAYRDYRVRYAQTLLGFLWALIQPLFTLLIFVLIFGRAIQIDTGGIPYPLFAVVGMSAWTFFAYVLNQSGVSIIASQEMIKKIYFPRLTIPLSKAVVGFIDYSITLVMVLLLMIYYQYPISWNIALFPLFFLVLVVLSLSIGIWLSALTIRYRDFQHVIPFLVQFGLYATPVAYPAQMVPEEFHWLYYSNPMAGLIEGFRWSLLDTAPPSPYGYFSYVITAVLFVSGLIYFRRVESSMADLV